QRTRKPLPRDESPLASHDRPTGADATHAATPRRVGTAAAPLDRGCITCGVASHLTRRVGSGTAALCRASTAVRLAEPITSTDTSPRCSAASEVVGATGNRYSVTFAVLRFRTSPVRTAMPGY